MPIYVTSKVTDQHTGKPNSQLTLTTGTKMPHHGLHLIEKCSNGSYTIYDLRAYNLVWSISSMPMAALTLLILTAFLLDRAYKTPLQRLFLYLTVSTLLSLTNNSLNLVLHSDSFNEHVCRAIGYIDVSLTSISLLLATGLGLYLVLVVSFLIRGRSLPKMHTYIVCGIELAYVSAVVVTPPVLLSSQARKFGVAGVLCWVQTYNQECHRERRGLELQVLLIFTTIMAVNLGLFVLLGVTSGVLASRQESAARSQHLRLTKRASLLVACLSVSLAINITSLWGHYATADSHTHIAVLIVMALLVPTSPAIIPVGFMFYLNSTKKFSHLKSIAGRLKRLLVRSLSSRSTELIPPCHEEKDGEKGEGSGGKGVSLARPWVQDPPSMTVSREVGYTGAFTDITRTSYGSIDQTTYSE